jgi:hypothetical protein
MKEVTQDSKKITKPKGVLQPITGPQLNPLLFGFSKKHNVFSSNTNKAEAIFN